MEYKDTLNLPKTSFSMKADLKKLEPSLQKRWEEIETAQERVEALYARWEELEAKAT